MGRAQELFDRASAVYDKAIARISVLDEVYQKAHKKDNPNFKGWDTKVTLAQFDLILQAILLTTAVSDGEFHRLERQFVDKITDYGDLLVFIKKETNGDLDLTWDGIAALSSDTQRKLAAILPSLLDKCCDNFVRPLATVDRAIDSQDFLDQITGNIAEISSYLADVDGSTTKGEATAAAKSACALLVNRWHEIVNG